MNDLRSANLNGKTVALRCDLNVPTDSLGNVADDTRLLAALPTLEYIAAAGAKVLLFAHFKRPKGSSDPTMSLQRLGPVLSAHLGRRVEFATDCIGAPVIDALSRIHVGEVVLAENVRFHPGELENDPTFAQALAAPADVYVNDAFGAAHRSHASVVGLANLLPAYPGFLLRSEVETLTSRLEDPKRPLVAVIGGAKISTKLGVVCALLDKVDTLLVGGGMANTFLASQGHNMQQSLVEAQMVTQACDIMNLAKSKGVHIALPTDGVMGSDTSEDPLIETHQVTRIPVAWAMFDIGPITADHFSTYLAEAGTVVWNGPMGMAERPAFAKGTIKIAQAVSTSSGYSIVGGGDSVAALKKTGLLDSIDHVSTGCGASLELLEGKLLPGIAALT